MTNTFTKNLTKNLGELTCQYDKTTLIGDSNLTTDNKNLEIFMGAFNLECLINKPTCFQPENPSCIELVLTNKKELFKHPEAIQVEISHHHSFFVAFLKSKLVKGNANIQKYTGIIEHLICMLLSKIYIKV